MPSCQPELTHQARETSLWAVGQAAGSIAERKPTVACEEAGAPLSSHSKHAIAYGVGDWGHVWKQGKREGQAFLAGPPQQDDCAVQEDGRVVQEGWSTLAKVENSSPQSRLNSGAFCKGPLEPPAEHKNT